MIISFEWAGLEKTLWNERIVEEQLLLMLLYIIYLIQLIIYRFLNTVM